MGRVPAGASQKQAAAITQTLKSITVDDLHRTISKLPAGLSEGDKSLALCGAFLRHLFGIEWLEQNLLPTVPKHSYLRLDESVSLEEKHARIIRVGEFCEALFNLRDISGIEACIQELINEKVPSACAELDTARMLRCFDVPFEFVVPKKLKTGEDYDFTIWYPDGLEVAVEAKCKFEENEFRPQSILNTLHDKRKQLPKGRPGIFLIKVPADWIQTVAMANAVVATANKFFSRGTRRVVSVKFYAQPVFQMAGFTVGTHVFSEVSNPNAIIPNRKWDLFEGSKTLVLGQLRGAMPDWWIRFIYFPHGYRP
jgi:hypothetical protein